MLRRRRAHLLVQVKGNQPTLFQQLKRLPWAQIPVGHRTRETAYLTVSLPVAQALPRDLQTWIRRHWHIENRPTT